MSTRFGLRYSQCLANWELVVASTSFTYTVLASESVFNCGSVPQSVYQPSFVCLALETTSGGYVSIENSTSTSTSTTTSTSRATTAPTRTSTTAAPLVTKTTAAATTSTFTSTSTSTSSSVAATVATPAPTTSPINFSVSTVQAARNGFNSTNTSVATPLSTITTTEVIHSSATAASQRYFTLHSTTSIKSFFQYTIPELASHCI